MSAPVATPAAPIATAPAPPAVPPTPDPRRADSFIDRLIHRHGSPDAALRDVTSQLFSKEDEIASLTSQLAALRSRLPEGSIIVPKEEATNLAKLRALGTVDEIVAAVTERNALRTQVADHEIDKIAAIAAPLAGLDPLALAAHIRSEKQHVEMRDTPVVENGKTVTKKMPFIRPAGEANAPLKAIAEYVNALASYQQRALKVSGAGGDTTTIPGVPHPTQTPTPTTPPVSNSVTKFRDEIERQKASRPSPLTAPVTPLPFAVQTAGAALSPPAKSPGT